MTPDKIIEIAGFLIGLLYLWWEYHADRRMWIAGLIMPAVSMAVYFSKGLYADFAMNIYYLVMAVYGIVVWGPGCDKKKLREKPNAGEKESLPIRKMPLKVWLGCGCAFIPIYAAIAAWLVFLTDSNVPYADAFTTAMSIVATWMLARKYIEQWWAWIAVDVVCVALFIYKGIYFYSILYAIYTVIAFFGYAKWKRMMAGH